MRNEIDSWKNSADESDQHIPLHIVDAITANNAYMRDHEQAITKAKLNAKVYTGELERDFYQGISVTKALEDVIINGQGEIHDFPALAENLMENYIGSIQIAPGGVVTDIYPMEGNEGGLIDLIHDPSRGPVVRMIVIRAVRQDHMRRERTDP